MSYYNNNYKSFRNLYIEKIYLQNYHLAGMAILSFEDPRCKILNRLKNQYRNEST